jgi:hypothetical protein
MGQIYGDVITQVKTAHDATGEVFESGHGDALKAACEGAINALWSAAADSHDNLFNTSVVLVRYVNAVCDADHTNAKELDTQVDAINQAAGREESSNGLPDGTVPRLPDVNPDDPDGNYVPEPSDDPAERPEGS